MSSGLLFVALVTAAQAGAFGRTMNFGAALRLMLPGNVWLARKLVEMQAGLGLFNSCLLAREATRLDYGLARILVLSLVKAGPLDVSVETGYVEPPAWPAAGGPTPSTWPGTGKSYLGDTMSNYGGGAHTSDHLALRPDRIRSPLDVRVRRRRHFHRLRSCSTGCRT